MKTKLIIEGIEDAIIENIGEKCPDYCKGCFICDVWKYWELIEKEQRK